MKRPAVLALALLALLFVPLAPSFAQTADYTPVKVTLKLDNKAVLATLNGLKVRITNNKDDFIGHSYFISQADVLALAKKRKVALKLDLAKKKMTLGTDIKEIIAPDPAGTDSFAFGKVRMVAYKGKNYFDVQGLWQGLGFNSCSKMIDGFNLGEPKKK